jgi:MFS family permease
MSDASPRPLSGSSRGSGWRPLRTPAFRRLWSAQFVSNVGSWMQTVAAQWVMLSLTSSAVLIGAISAAGSLPVLLLGIPAGALGDLVDRRRLIILTQVVMLVAAAALAVFAAFSGLTPALILALLFVIGCGSAAGAATWQTLQPELVPAELRTEAIALGSVNQNLARAVGPALGGLLLAGTSAALVFGVNAISFVAVLFAVALTAIPPRRLPVPREHVVDAVRAGGRYVAYSPTLLALIARTAAFIFPAGAIWALLPLVARDKLGLGSAGYGILLGCVGIGAFVAATLGPALRRRLSPKGLYALAATVIAATAAVLAVSTSVFLDAGGLILAGSAWISGLGLLGASYQSEMPPWVKARGMSYYLVAFQGANALGGLGFGAVAEKTSLTAAFLAITGSLSAAVLVTWRLAFPATTAADIQPGEPWPLPEIDPGLADGAGPVMVNVRWPVRHDATDTFLDLAPELRRIRRRTGATSWRLYRDTERPDELIESFIVGTWDEHERQHQRVYPRDASVLDQLDATLAHPRQVEHFLAVRAPAHPPAEGLPNQGLTRRGSPCVAARRR